MNALLMTEAFDDFYMEEVTLTTYNTFQIDGHMNADFYSSDEIAALPEGKLEPYSKWRDIRPVCFSLIKGKKTPVSFKFVLHAPDKIVYALCENPEAVKGLVLNIRYEQGKVSIITATSYHTFIMDKSLDQIWDKYLPNLLTKLQIDFDILT